MQQIDPPSLFSDAAPLQFTAFPLGTFSQEQIDEKKARFDQLANLLAGMLHNLQSFFSGPNQAQILHAEWGQALHTTMPMLKFYLDKCAELLGDYLAAEASSVEPGPFVIEGCQWWWMSIQEQFYRWHKHVHSNYLLSGVPQLSIAQILNLLGPNASVGNAVPVLQGETDDEGANGGGQGADSPLSLSFSSAQDDDDDQQN